MITVVLKYINRVDLFQIGNTRLLKVKFKFINILKYIQSIFC